jgi:hypothetical protein
METTNDTTRQQEPPTHAEIAERQFSTDAVALIQAWRAAGKPHKR